MDATNLPLGTTFLAARTGETTFEVTEISDRPGHRGVYMRVRTFNPNFAEWQVVNPRAHFTFRHVTECVESGVWTETRLSLPATEATEATGTANGCP